MDPQEPTTPPAPQGGAPEPEQPETPAPFGQGGQDAGSDQGAGGGQPGSDQGVGGGQAPTPPAEPAGGEEEQTPQQ